METVSQVEPKQLSIDADYIKDNYLKLEYTQCFLNHHKGTDECSKKTALIKKEFAGDLSRAKKLDISIYSNRKFRPQIVHVPLVKQHHWIKEDWSIGKVTDQDVKELRNRIESMREKIEERINTIRETFQNSVKQLS